MHSSCFQIACVYRCADKHINGNQKIMQVFMEVQPQIVAKRMEKVEQQMAEAQAAAATEAQTQAAAESTESQAPTAVEAETPAQ